MLTATSWFDGVEQLALSALEEDADLDRIDQEAEAIAPPSPEHRGGASYRTDRAVSVELVDGNGVDAAAGAIDGVLGLLASRYTLWWTSGSDRFKPSLVFAEGLPSVERFAALLDGKWERWGWKTR
jgi:type VI secretion system protein ImpM